MLKLFALSNANAMKTHGRELLLLKHKLSVNKLPKQLLKLNNQSKLLNLIIKESQLTHLKFLLIQCNLNQLSKL